MSFQRKVIEQVLMVALWVTPCILPGYSSDVFEGKSEARLTVHNVGVGQCYDLEMYDSLKKKKKYMLIGFGIEEDQNPSPESVSISSGRSKVHLTPSDYRVPSPTRPLSSQELVKELRAKFKQENGTGEGIDVDTVILTHPMKDHGLLMDLFSYETDRLEQLWLAGLPEQYYEDKQDKFRSWLEAKRLKKTEIRFLAVEKTSTGSIYSKENRKYKQAYFTPLVKDGEKKLNFGAIKVSFLSVNPTHFQGYGGTGLVGSQEVLRSCFPEDSQSDSLLLKIICGKSSILLSGSATSLTTNRAINNYSDDPKALQASVLVASQYGSTLQGANNKEWLEKVNPEYVIISHGSSQATFDQTFYDSLKDRKGLKDSLSPHEIEVQLPEEHVLTTQQGIFSTLKSGTITIDLYKKGLKIRTEKEGEISQPGVKDPLEKQSSVLIRRPDHHSHSLLFSARSSPNAKSSPKSSSEEMKRDSGSRASKVSIGISSSPQIKKIREKDLPRAQSLSLIQEKDSAREKLHEKTPFPKTPFPKKDKREKQERHVSHKNRKQENVREFNSDESTSESNTLERSDRKKAVSEKKHRARILSSSQEKTNSREKPNSKKFYNQKQKQLDHVKNKDREEKPVSSRDSVSSKDDSYSNESSNSVTPEQSRESYDS